MTSIGNLRRAERKSVHDMILVEDAISGTNIGRIGNLSRSGLMLVGTQRLHDDALYQLRFSLPDDEAAEPLEIGVHEQWTERAAVPGQFWSGLRIIDISVQAERRLTDWLAKA